MEKLSDEELKDLTVWWKYVERYPNHDDILACLLELKQLRDEKRHNGNGQNSDRVR
jgi:hypothetical protein